MEPLRPHRMAPLFPVEEVLIRVAFVHNGYYGGRGTKRQKVLDTALRRA
jgi:hypothetical protein